MPREYLFTQSAFSVRLCWCLGKQETLTTTRLREFNQTERCIIRRNRLKSNIAMPLCRLLLLGAQLFRFGSLVELIMLNGADGADFRITATKFSLRIENGMNVQTRGLRAASELAEFEDQFLLQIVGEVVLCSEEDDTSFRDCLCMWPLVGLFHLPRGVLE